jgi:hypothetical protein
MVQVNRLRERGVVRRPKSKSLIMAERGSATTTDLRGLALQCLQDTLAGNIGRSESSTAARWASVALKTLDMEYRWGPKSVGGNHRRALPLTV